MKWIRHIGKRTVVILLIVSMLLPMIPYRQVKADTVTEGETNTNNTEANKETLMSEAGIDVSKSSGVKTEEGRNPLTGGNDVSVSMNPSPELLVGGVGSYDASNRQQNVIQTVYDLEGKDSFSRENGRIVKDESHNSNNYDDEVITAVRTVAFDPFGDGADKYVAELTAVHAYTGSTYNTITGTLIYMTVYDATKSKEYYDEHWHYSDRTFVGFLRFDIEEWQADAYMQVAPGDFDGDGCDELAVYCPTNIEKGYNDTSLENTCSYVTVYEVNDDGTETLQINNSLSEEHRYYINPARNANHGSKVYYKNAVTEICAVDLETIRHPGNTKDSLAIATSPARNGTKVTETKDAETQVDIWLDVTQKPKGDNLSQHDMRWDLHTYDQKKKEEKEYDVMMFGGLSAGDLDNDGNDELVVAGYRIRNTGNTKKWQFDSNVLFVERLIPNANGYESSGTVPQILNLTKKGIFSWLTGFASDNEPTAREKIMLSPLSVECYKGRGRDFADVFYIDGTVYEWKSDYKAAYIRENKNGESKGGYAITTCIFDSSKFKSFQNSDHAKMFTNAIVKGYVSFSNMVSGNFNNNPYGIEQVYSVMHYMDGEKIGSSIVGVGQKQVGEYDTSSGVTFTYNDIGTFGKCATIPLCAPDVDQDGTRVGYTSQEIYYSDPQPIAILQAPPYHSELNEVDGNYVSTGSTGFTVANAKGESTTHSFTATAGVIVGAEQSFSLFGLFKTGISTMTELSGGVGYEGTTTTTTTFETDYNLTTTDHVIALTVPYVRYRYKVQNPSFTTLSKKELKELSTKISRLKSTPASKEKKQKIKASIIVLQEYYDNQLELAKQYGYGKTVKNETIEMTYAQPGKPTMATLTKEKYNALVTQLNEPNLYISDDVLHNATPGDVATYMWDGNTNTKGYSWGEGKRENTAAVTVSESGSSISRSISEEKESEKALTWNAGLHQENTITAGGLTVGYSTNLEYAGAKADVKISTSTAHGTVALIPNAINDGKGGKNKTDEPKIENNYNFNYNIASWSTKIGGNDCRVVGYEVTPFVNGQKFPPKPVKEVEIIPVYERNVYQGVKVRWSLEDVNTAYYREPQSFKVLINDADSSKKIVSAADATVAGEDYYEVSFSAVEAPIGEVLVASVRPTEIPIANKRSSDAVYIMAEDSYESIFATQPGNIFCKQSETGDRKALITAGINFSLKDFQFSDSKLKWQYLEPGTSNAWKDLSDNINIEIADDIGKKLEEYGLSKVVYQNDTTKHTYSLDIQYNMVPRGLKFRLVVPYSVKGASDKTYYATSRECEFSYVFEDVVAAKIASSDNGNSNNLILNAQTKNGETRQQFAPGMLKNLSDNAGSKNVLLNANQDTNVTVTPGVYQLELTNIDKSILSSDRFVHYGDKDALLATTANKITKKRSTRMRVQSLNATSAISDVRDMTFGESLQLNTDLYSQNAEEPNVPQTVDVIYRVVSDITGEDVTNDCMAGDMFAPNSAGSFTIYANVTGENADAYADVMAIKKINVKASGERYSVENLEKIIGANIGDITGVAYGCAKNAEQLGLPATTQIQSDNGNVYDAMIDWNVDGCDYDPAKKSDQTFTVTGNVVLPDTIDNTNQISTQVSVNVMVDSEAVTITEPELNTSDGVMIKDATEPENPDATEPENPDETPNPGDTTEPGNATDPGNTSIPTTTEQGSSTTTIVPEPGNVYVVGGMNYEIITTGTVKTVQITGIDSKNLKTLRIPDTVLIFGEEYMVTSIKAGAFKNQKKLKKVIIGKNVTEIGKGAFCGCKRLKTIVIQTNKLKKKSIGKNAFAKISSKPKFQVPKKQLKVYKKLIQKSKVTSKAKFTK